MAKGEPPCQRLRSPQAGLDRHHAARRKLTSTAWEQLPYLGVLGVSSGECPTSLSDRVTTYSCVTQHLSPLLTDLH